ncbi:uncharacterized protein [Rutidosis leptorrhynchoides]|uniref:uncharacterized protein n=1 Tax=Rutidosis leptorrhynchoides TaxID=125765 RepID=UPI003A990087
MEKPNTYMGKRRAKKQEIKQREQQPIQNIMERATVDRTNPNVSSVEIVVRSRLDYAFVCGDFWLLLCLYESCKNCCSKAQNPCHIHVLKHNANLDKSPAPSNPLFDMQKVEVSSPGISQRIHARRQHYSKSLIQFNNSQSLHARKPLTTKDASLAMNEWRLSKLNEYKERNIEVENEAFGRSNPLRVDNFRKRIQQIVNVGFKKPEEKELNIEKTSAFSDLIDRLGKVRNEDDLKSCIHLKSKLCGSSKYGNEEDA